MALIKCPQCGKPISKKARKCPHCGCNTQNMLELRKLKRILIPIVSVCLVALLVILIYLKNDKSRKDTQNTDPQDARVEALKTETDSIIVPAPIFEDTTKTVEDTMMMVEDTLPMIPVPIDSVTTEIVEQPQPVVEQPQPAVEKPQEKPAKPQVSKLDLGYATYEPMEGASGIKNGKPNGNGIMRFKRRQTIPGTEDCVAEPGEWVNGAWRDGKVNVGTWYRNDGNQVIVKLGQRYNK